jgi:hypothetical protein
MAKKLTPPQDGVNVKGMYRVHLTEDGKVLGDSGWQKNQIVTQGFNAFLCETLGAIAGSSQVGFMALGTGTAPGTSDTALNGEISASTKRTAVTAASSSTSKSVQFTATFSSANSFLAGSSNISNIGLYAASSGSNLFAGNTYASSTCATNQNVNATYTLSFS